MPSRHGDPPAPPGDATMLRLHRAALSLTVLLLGALGCLTPAHAQEQVGPAGEDTAGPSGSATVIYLVRHAERAEDGTDDPPISEAGQERALLLTRMLTDAGIGAVHSTEYRRTRATAAPLAEALGLVVSAYDARSLGRFAARLRADGGRHLVVGHSNTTPALVTSLGGDPGPPIEEAEYDRLYVVTLFPSGASTVLLRFGAAGPS